MSYEQSSQAGLASHSLRLELAKLSRGGQILTIYSSGGTDGYSVDKDRGDKEVCSVSHERVSKCYMVLDGALMPS